MCRIGILKVTDFIKPNKENVDYKNVDNIYDISYPRPTAWHSWAAATRGFVHIFNREDNEILKTADLIIVVLDKYIAPIESIFAYLNNNNIPFVVAFHEGYQVLQYLTAPNNRMDYFFYIRNLMAQYGVRHIIDPMSPRMATLLNTWSFTQEPTFKVHNIPAAWPVDIVGGKYYTTPDERAGIIIINSDIRNFITRNTLLSMAIASELSQELSISPTIILTDISIPKEEFINKHNRLFYKPNFIFKSMPYVEWLKLLSEHKIALNMDMSWSQGQAVGDCALTNIPCVGGNTAISQYIFPHLAADKTDMEEILNTCKSLLNDNVLYKEELTKLRIAANQEISFKKTVERFHQLYMEIISGK